MSYFKVSCTTFLKEVSPKSQHNKPHKIDKPARSRILSSGKQQAKLKALTIYKPKLNLMEPINQTEVFERSTKQFSTPTTRWN